MGGRRLMSLTLAGCLMLTPAACGSSSHGGGEASKSPSSKPSQARVSAASVPTGDWPLTVTEGTVRCEGSPGAGAVIFSTTDGREYGVNGTALDQGLPRIDPIWKRDPDVPGARINISPILDRGLKLCH